MAETFTPEQRTAVREALVATAQEDPDVVAAALVGSTARGEEDRWSDIDLVLGIDTSADPIEVAGRWTAMMRERHGSVHELDVVAGGVLYRVFLLASSLQVDISFWPQDQVRATEPGFRLLFGEVNEPTTPADPDPEAIIGWAWLYALHARSAIARGRTWQAVMMLDDLRNQVLALACVRHGLVSFHGRGVDRLPEDWLARLAAIEEGTTATAALERRATGLLGLLEEEVAAHGPALTATLLPTLRLLAPSSRPATTDE